MFFTLVSLWVYEYALEGHHILLYMHTSEALYSSGGGIYERGVEELKERDMKLKPLSKKTYHVRTGDAENGTESINQHRNVYH